MTFEDLGLSAPLLRAIGEQGYNTPTPIQQQAIPPVSQGRDVMAAAQTGTGKTAGFTLPLLQRLHGGPAVRANQARALVLTPTRELAAQVADSVATYGRHMPLRSAVVFGGVKINPQMKTLLKGVDVLIATPGRLIDLYNQNAVRFDQLEILVLDEADRMLDMGFIHDIRRIMAILPKKRQTLMFSATFSDEIRKLAKGLVTDPVEVSVSPPNSTAQRVRQRLFPVDKKRKPALLASLIADNQWQQVLVFTRTKHGANKLVRYLEDGGIKAMAIHGNKSQSARTKALAEFKNGRIPVLVATDIAARGLDIEQLPQVVNFDLPQVPEDYVHRIGRTARAGAEGDAVSLVAADEIDQLRAIERLIKKTIPRETMDGFEPDHDLPESRLDSRPPRAARPKKPRPANAGNRPGGNRSADKAANNRPQTAGRGRSAAPRAADGRRQGNGGAAPNRSSRSSSTGNRANAAPAGRGNRS